MRVWLHWLVLGCLLLALWGCSGIAETPPQTVVERALAVRIAHIQQQLISHLRFNVPQTPNAKLRQVTITERRPVTLPVQTPAADSDSIYGSDSIYQVTGTYDALIQLPSRQAEESGDFEVYVRAEIDDTVEPVITHWYLLEPDDTGWQQTALNLP